MAPGAKVLALELASLKATNKPLARSRYVKMEKGTNLLGLRYSGWILL
jgi:hypothetical protein